jgi:hypothetical protein
MFPFAPLRLLLKLTMLFADYVLPKLHLKSGPGNQNSAIGSQALDSYNVGVNDMTLGFEALYANTTGSYNTAVGCKFAY